MSPQTLPRFLLLARAQPESNGDVLGQSAKLTSPREWAEGVTRGALSELGQLQIFDFHPFSLSEKAVNSDMAVSTGFLHDASDGFLQRARPGIERKQTQPMSLK